MRWWTQALSQQSFPVSCCMRLVDVSIEPLPELEESSARFYGKDGQKGNRPLNITAQVTLNPVANGKSASVPFFVQSDSEQSCLLGTNATLVLGFKFLRADGRPLLVQSAKLSHIPDAAMVHQSSTLPGRKGCFLEVRVDAPVEKGDEFQCIGTEETGTQLSGGVVEG